MRKVNHLRKTGLASKFQSLFSTRENSSIGKYIVKTVARIIYDVRLQASITFSLFCLIAIPLPAPAQDPANYRISPNDVLDFKVFQEPDLDAQVRIAADGTAIFPLIGSVNLGAKTVSEATGIIRQRYLNGYLVNPQVSLIIQAYARRTFTVLGQVQRPGAYEIVGDQSIGLLEAIGMAGGYTRIADPGKITIRRTENGQEQVFKVNAKHPGKNGDALSQYRAESGDIITVGESIF
jgi:protein involved in polysaccharide export with SLBB domain